MKMKTKISPYDIADDVMTIEIPDNDYNFNTQSRFDVLSTPMATTYNGTQTFDSYGKPKDQDNDK